MTDLVDDGLRTIVCFGDSNTYGWDPEIGDGGGRLGRDARWPGVLRAELGPGYDVIEDGLGGRTAGVDDPYSEFRDGRQQILPCLWSHAPVDLVAIMLGTNDFKETFHRSAVDIARAGNLLVELALRSLAGPGDTPPEVLLIAPAPLGPAAAIQESSGFIAGIAESQRLGRLYRGGRRQRRSRRRRLPGARAGGGRHRPPSLRARRLVTPDPA